MKQLFMFSVLRALIQVATPPAQIKADPTRGAMTGYFLSRKAWIRVRPKAQRSTSFARRCVVKSTAIEARLRNASDHSYRSCTICVPVC